MSLPKAIEYPNNTHSTPTRPKAETLIIIMFRTLLLRTMPP